MPHSGMPHNAPHAFLKQHICIARLSHGAKKLSEVLLQCSKRVLLRRLVLGHKGWGKRW
jgi:hypothetical protein